MAKLCQSNNVIKYEWDCILKTFWLISRYLLWTFEPSKMTKTSDLKYIFSEFLSLNTFYNFRKYCTDGRHDGVLESGTSEKNAVPPPPKKKKMVSTPLDNCVPVTLYEHVRRGHLFVCVCATTCLRHFMPYRNVSYKSKISTYFYRVPISSKIYVKLQIKQKK